MPPKSLRAAAAAAAVGASSSGTSSAESIYEPRRHIGVLAERATHVSSTDYPGHYPDEDHSWSLERFKKKLIVKVVRLSNRSVEFDLVGLDASIANAFRRIIISEVPTIAVENVYVWDNTSIVVDEVLSHRIGLVPLNVDPQLMDMKSSPTDQATDRNTLVFKTLITCTRNPSAPKGSIDPNELYIDHEFLSSHLRYEAMGEQTDVFSGTAPAPTNPNIVLAKLRPGQSINLEMHAVKGVGKDHAKFSPVATATYRTLPLIILNPSNPVPPHLATKFQKCFSPGVIRVDPRTKAVSVDEKKMRADTVSREVLRHPEFEGKVELKRVRDYFLFSVESEGPYQPERLLPESIKIMRSKIVALRRAVEDLLINTDGVGGGDVEMADA